MDMNTKPRENPRTLSADVYMFVVFFFGHMVKKTLKFVQTGS